MLLLIGGKAQVHPVCSRWFCMSCPTQTILFSAVRVSLSGTPLLFSVQVNTKILLPDLFIYNLRSEKRCAGAMRPIASQAVDQCDCDGAMRPVVSRAMGQCDEDTLVCWGGFIKSPRDDQTIGIWVL